MRASVVTTDGYALFRTEPRPASFFLTGLEIPMVMSSFAIEKACFSFCSTTCSYLTHDKRCS